MAKSYVVNSFLWGVLSKITDATIKFISIPFLLSYFGRENFGLIALATSVNAYLHLLDMGVNTGAIKYFSEWIAGSKYNHLNKVARTSITFYGAIGAINSIILVIIAYTSLDMFSITQRQIPVLRSLFLILALFTLLNWATSVFNQLLTANEKINYVQKINVVRSLLSLLIIFLTIWLKWNIEAYFLAFTVVNSITVVPYYLKAKKDGLIDSFIPATDWKDFAVIFKYSLAIVAMGVFQMSATKLRPIVLSIFSTEGVGIVADYRVLETLTLFIISIGSMFISIFLPKTSKLVLENNPEKMRDFAYKGTLYTSIICVVLCLPFVVCGTEILTLYVGTKFENLNIWLTIWVFTILFSLHNSPVSSLVLATGKTRMLVYSSAIACIISLLVNAALAKSVGVGSAIIGYSLYIVIQMSFYYFYFNSRVLKLNSWLVFRSFIIPVILGLSALLIVVALQIEQKNLIVQTTLKLTLWVSLFISLLFLFRVINFKSLYPLVTRGKAIDR